MEYSQLRRELRAKPFEFHQIQFPVSHIDNGLFEDANGFTFALPSRAVAGYMYLQKNSDGGRFYTYKEMGQMYTDGRYSELAVAMNMVFLGSRPVTNQLKFGHIDKPEEYQWLGVMRGAMLHGIVSKHTHNSLLHNEVLDIIEENALQDLVKHVFLDGDVMVLYLQSDNGLDKSIYLKLTNGLAGRKPFKIEAIYQVGDVEMGRYEKVIAIDKITEKRRHQNNLKMAIEKLRETLLDVDDHQFDRFVLDIKPQKAIDKLREICNDVDTERSERVYVNVAKKKYISARSVLYAIEHWRQYRGYKTFVTTTLDKMIDWLYDEYKQEKKDESETE